MCVTVVSLVAALTFSASPPGESTEGSSNVDRFGLPVSQQDEVHAISGQVFAHTVPHDCQTISCASNTPVQPVRFPEAHAYLQAADMRRNERFCVRGVTFVVMVVDMGFCAGMQVAVSIMMDAILK